MVVFVVVRSKVAILGFGLNMIVSPGFITENESENHWNLIFYQQYYKKIYVEIFFNGFVLDLSPLLMLLLLQSRR